MKDSNGTVISLAEVRNRVDPGRSGAFRAKVDSEGNTEQTVYYVSPYASNGVGAFVAIPEVGTEILVCKPAGSSSWYYIGATFAPESKEAVATGASSGKIKDASLMPFDRVDPEMYKARGTPMRYLFRSPEGAGILMSDEYNPDFINKKTEITSTGAKKITLHDAPTIDSITIDSGNGSRITLTDNPQTQGLPARSVEVFSVGPQKYINKESQTDILVAEGGRELQVLNNANGVAWGDSANAGNVNVQSKWKDVNVFTQAEQGRIFIECLNENGSNQQIVIETNGTGGGIIVKTKGTISISADEDINMKAGGDLNIECSKLSISTESSVEIESGSSVNIDGTEVYLASDKANPNPAQIADEQSTYGNIGVTTY
jgi:hypothetical protein